MPLGLTASFVAGIYAVLVQYSPGPVVTVEDDGARDARSAKVPGTGLARGPSGSHFAAQYRPAVGLPDGHMGCTCLRRLTDSTAVPDHAVRQMAAAFRMGASPLRQVSIKSRLEDVQDRNPACRCFSYAFA